ncbi:MAG TPA: ornithine cyclodeaminase family protein [Anaerolineae bacterium]|nr:ornithine cyclodeaminase family protein [Anaerolineae bacterium]
MDIRVLSAKEVCKALPMADAIEAMKRAFRQLSGGKAELPLRSRIEIEQGFTLFMPAYLHQHSDLAVKIVSVFPQNPEQGLPTIHAAVLLLDSHNGAPIALMEGASLTAIRTGAASGAATDLLASPEAKTVAILGSGVQARTQLEAVCTVREIERAWVYSIDPPGMQTFVKEMAGYGPIPQDLKLAKDADQAVSQADIICTATTSSTPVFDGTRVPNGVHINAVGSFTPAMQELDEEIIKRATVIVDSRQAVLAEAGDLIIPIQRGVISEAWIQAELGEIVQGTHPGRVDPDQITVFKSVGVAVQDAAAAAQAFIGASQAGLGHWISL